MKNLDFKDIIFEDYNEVTAEKYTLYYEQDTMMIRWRAYDAHYFVRKDAVGTKEKMSEDLEKQFLLLYKSIRELLTSDIISEERMRQSIEKIFNLKEKYKQVFFPELDELIRSLLPLKEKLNAKI